MEKTVGKANALKICHSINCIAIITRKSIKAQNRILQQIHAPTSKKYQVNLIFFTESAGMIRNLFQIYAKLNK